MDTSHVAARDTVREDAHEDTLRSVAVKICGLTRHADAAHAEATGAAFLGVIMAGGPRHVSVAQARDVLGPRRDGVKRVVVFGTQCADEIVDIMAALDADVAQLHVAHDRALIAAVRDRSGRAVWPVLRVASTTEMGQADGMASETGNLVLDACVAGGLGGTGVALDWASLVGWLDEFRTRHPALQIVLAGGLRPGNVSEAMRILLPDVVDVSSGVEASPGVKDPEVVERFVEAVRNMQRP